MILDELHKALLRYPNGTKLDIEWENGLKVSGKIDTLYESNNGLESDEPGYKEYYACAFEVDSIISTPKPNEHSSTYEWLKQGKSPLIEISIEIDPPKKVVLKENQIVIWQKN